MNFLRRLALRMWELDDSSRLDVVEIARVPDMLPSLYRKCCPEKDRTEYSQVTAGCIYRGADKSLALPGRIQDNVSVRMA